MKKKLLCVISVMLVALCMCVFAGCDGTTDELKSGMGVTLTGGGFGKKAKLITEKVEMTEATVKSTIDKLPEEFKLLADEKMAAIDISVESDGVKVQPSGKVKVSVPAPIEGVEEYMVFHIRSENKVERLDCEFKDGMVVFETDSFSPYVFLDSSDSSAVVVKNPGPCEGTVVVTWGFKLYNRVIESKYKVYSGEEKTIYSRADRVLKLSAECGYDFVHSGWFAEEEGKAESTPFSTESTVEHKTAAGEKTIVCKFAADLTDMESVWAFPGNSNMPKGYADGRAATSVYIKPGNQVGIDLSKLIIKGKKKKDGKLMYTLLAPEQFVVTGLDELDYSKEGEYRVEYRVRVSDEKDLTLVVTVYVSEKNSDVMVKAGKGGRFYMEEKYDVYSEKQLIFADKDRKYSITAVPDRDFDFGGWYKLYDGGVLGDLLSENATYEVGMSDYDLSIIAMFEIKPEKSNLKTDVYQLHLWAGESGLPPVVRDGEVQRDAQNVLYYRPGTPETDFLNVDVRGFRRKDDQTDGNMFEYVQLLFGDYSIDYGGLDFNKEGVYYMKYTVHFSRIDKAVEDKVYNAFYVYVSERFAHLTVELAGKGSVTEKNNVMSEMNQSNAPFVFDYFNLGQSRELLAKPADGYKFVGWYLVDEEGNLSAEPVSTEPEYVFRQNGKDVHIKALFVEEVDWLTLTCDGFEGGFFHYSLSSKEQADLTGLVVTTNNGNALDASDYIVDASRVDYTKTGDHEIVITYKYDKEVSATLMVNVPKAETYSYLLDRDETQGVIQKDGKDVVYSSDGYREEVDLGGTLTLTAVPKEGYRFAGWYITNVIDSGTEEKRFYSSNATETFTITDNTYIYAQFAEKERVTLTVIAGEHGNVYDNNVGNSSAEKRLQFVVTEGSVVKVYASGEAGYFKFVGWYDGEGETAELISDKEFYEFTVTGDATVYARFDYAFFVNAIIKDPDAGEFIGEGVSDKGHLYIDDLPDKASVTVEVKPKAGYRFIGWFPSSDNEGYNEDLLLSTDLKYTFTVSEKTGNVHLTALFRGTVTGIKLHGLSDYYFETDKNGNPMEEYVFNLNSEVWVDFEHVNVLGKVGDRYERLCRGLEYSIESTIGVSENNMLDTSKVGSYTVTYTYLANPALKVVINIRIAEHFSFLAQCYEHGWGYITENGKEVDFGNGRMVEKGTVITLTAVANEGYNFLGWYFYNEQQGEALISKDATYTFTVNRGLYVFAKFAEKEMRLFNAHTAPYNGGHITENGKEVDFGNGRMVEKGTVITLSAVANDGFTFAGWYKSVGDQTEELISPDANYAFTVNEETHVYARFVENPDS